MSASHAERRGFESHRPLFLKILETLDKSRVFAFLGLISRLKMEIGLLKLDTIHRIYTQLLLSQFLLSLNSNCLLSTVKHDKLNAKQKQNLYLWCSIFFTTLRTNSDMKAPIKAISHNPQPAAVPKAADTQIAAAEVSP